MVCMHRSDDEDEDEDEEDRGSCAWSFWLYGFEWRV
jgi:hypothetical protein